MWDHPKYQKVSAEKCRKLQGEVEHKERQHKLNCDMGKLLPVQIFKNGK